MVGASKSIRNKECEIEKHWKPAVEVLEFLDVDLLCKLI
jgi:hypothetical protein